MDDNPIPMKPPVLRRTFAAKNETDPEKRALLNQDALTSEYYPSKKYLVRAPINTPQKHVNHTFTSKAEAQGFADSL